MAELPPFLSVRGDDLVLRIKAVPGAKRDALAGALGDRLKVRVAAPPEDGRANAAIRELLARCCGVNARDIELELGASTPLKTRALRVHAADAARIVSLVSREVS